MLDTILQASTQSLTMKDFLLCTICSLGCGAMIGWLYMFRNTYRKNFVISLVVLPAIIQVVIMMVNGNLGTGVAVMGAFSLVRFRSVPGSATEITMIFLAMAIGLATGMGYIMFALLFLIVLGSAYVLLQVTPYGQQSVLEKSMKITIPETLDFEGTFDEVLKRYVRKCELLRVRTTNMGSLYELQYHIVLKKAGNEKQMIDELRCRNGNLPIVVGRVSANKEEL